MPHTPHLTAIMIPTLIHNSKDQLEVSCNAPHFTALTCTILLSVFRVSRHQTAHSKYSVSTQLRIHNKE